MRKRIPLWLCLLFFCIPVHVLFSEDMPYTVLEEHPAKTNKENNTPPLKRGLIATGETLLANVLLMSFNMTALRNQPWSVPSFKVAHDNFVTPWEWERSDGFIVNQLGHPYQGSFSFNAGRVNEFTFYQSLFFSAFGSVTWETFCEGQLASFNDFLTTTSSSAPLGEILFRLYAEAAAAGVPAPLAAIINPMAGFHRLVTDWEPPDYGRRIYQMEASLGAGCAETTYVTAESNRPKFSYRGPTTEVGISIVYGNPFLQESAIPFEHFEVDFQVGINPGSYMKIELLTEGYLVSFCPVDTETTMMSNGLLLRYDFRSRGKFHGKWTTIDQFGNALDWAVKYRHLFSGDFSLAVKLNVGFSLMGVSVYYHEPEDDYHRSNFGFGINEKCSFILNHKKLGTLDMSLYHYLMWSYPHPGINDIPAGRVNWIFAGITYSHMLTKQLSVGITGSFAWEWGQFSSGSAPDSEKSNKEIKVFLAWNI